MKGDLSMKMSEYEQLSDKIEKADRIMNEKYELEIWIEYFEKVIAGDRIVYVRSTDKRRYPTPEEIEKAGVDLKLYKEKMNVLDAQFAAL
jgi:hypothetical protein